MRPRTARRRGYAMLMVMVFVVLLLSIWSVAYRQISAAMAIERARTERAIRGEGALRAMAWALAKLEVDSAPTEEATHLVTVPTRAGPRAYSVTITPDEGSTGEFSIHVQ